MNIESPAFEHEAMIPKKYTCQGDDVNPPLTVDDVPDDAKSLVLIVDDPDAPGGTWDHWIVYDIDAEITGVDEDSKPAGGTAGGNSWGRNDYGGPCPPSGVHRYYFRLYALDATLNLEEGAGKADVQEAMQGHILESCDHMGRYEKT